MMSDCNHILTEWKWEKHQMNEKEGKKQKDDDDDDEKTKQRNWTTQRQTTIGDALLITFYMMSHERDFKSNLHMYIFIAARALIWPVLSNATRYLTFDVREFERVCFTHFLNELISALLELHIHECACVYMMCEYNGFAARQHSIEDEEENN